MKKYLRNILTSPPIKIMSDPNLKVELSMVFYIQNNGVVHYKDFSEVGNETNVKLPGIMEIIKGCEKTNTNKVAVVHNHPSGVATPSESDLKATKILSQNLKKANIQLVDHIIITPKKHCSFRESNS